VDGDADVRDVFEDALVGCRGAADVVFGLESVDGYDYAEALEIHPVARNGAERAGHDLGVDATPLEFRDDCFQFTEANERISSDDGDVEGLKFVDGLKDVSDKLVILEVRQLTECGVSVSAEMGGVVGVTAGTAERALAGNFNGKRWALAQENGLPCLHDF
jgi:hypothetical protein